MARVSPDYLRFMVVNLQRFNQKYVEAVGDYISRNVTEFSVKRGLFETLLGAQEDFLKSGRIADAYQKFLKVDSLIPDSAKEAKESMEAILEEVRRCAEGANISLEKKAAG